MDERRTLSARHVVPSAGSVDSSPQEGSAIDIHPLVETVVRKTRRKTEGCKVKMSHLTAQTALTNSPWIRGASKSFLEFV